MPSRAPSITVNESALLSASSGSISIGDVLIDDASTGDYVKATTANRGTRRAHGIALSAYSSTLRGSVRVQSGGIVPASITGLTAGSVSWVRTSSTGVCERCTPASGDDLLGKCDANGNLFLDPGKWDSSNYAGGGGGGGGTPGGADTQLQRNNAGAFGGITGATSDGTNLSVKDANFKITDDADTTKVAQFQASGITTGTTRTYTLPNASTTVVGTDATQTLTNKTIDADSNTITNIENADIKAGAAIAVAKLAPGSNGEVLQTTGGVTVWGAAPGGGSPGGADTQLQRNNAGAFGGISGVTTDGVGLTALKIADSAGGQYYTFAVSNLAADRTVTLPLLTGADTFVFEAHTQTLTNKTINGASNTLTVRLANDITGFGANVAAALATFSSANIATACTDETGSGSLVFATSPLLVTPTIADSAGGQKYIFAVSDLAADRTITLPLLAGNDTFVFAAFTQTLTNKTMDWGSNTMTFTSAQARTACSDETGSGGSLVFATSPTITTATLSSPTLSGNPVMSGFTTNASTGTINDVSRGGTLFLEFTNATGPTVTGFDATGAVDGTILWVYVSGGNVAVSHDSASSSAANRITLSSGISITMTTGTFTQFVYRSSRWRALTASAI